MVGPHCHVYGTTLLAKCMVGRGGEGEGGVYGGGRAQGSGPRVSTFHLEYMEGVGFKRSFRGVLGKNKLFCLDLFPLLFGLTFGV